jgi:hypothetical protein
MKLGCEAIIKVKVVRDLQSLMITQMNLNHTNHIISAENYSYYPQNRALKNADPQLKNEVATLIKSKSNHRIVLDHLIQSTSKAESNKAIWNFKNKLEAKSIHL